MWVRTEDSIGRFYFYNELTQEVSWSLPDKETQIETMHHIHTLSHIRRCLCIGICHRMKCAMQHWYDCTSAVQEDCCRKFVLPMSSLMSSWWEMRQKMIRATAAQLMMEEEVTHHRQRLLAFQKVEDATLEWEKEMANNKHSKEKPKEKE